MTDKEQKKIKSQLKVLRRLGLPADRSVEQMIDSLTKNPSKK